MEFLIAAIILFGVLEGIDVWRNRHSSDAYRSRQAAARARSVVTKTDLRGLSPKYANPYELACLASKSIEKILREQYSATGKGLHEYLDSIEGRINKETINQARFIATVRNRVVHNDGVIDNPESFYKTAMEVVYALDKSPAPPQRDPVYDIHLTSRIPDYRQPIAEGFVPAAFLFFLVAPLLYTGLSKPSVKLLEIFGAPERAFLTMDAFVLALALALCLLPFRITKRVKLKAR